MDHSGELSHLTKESLFRPFDSFIEYRFFALTLYNNGGMGVCIINVDGWNGFYILYQHKPTGNRIEDIKFACLYIQWCLSCTE